MNVVDYVTFDTVTGRIRQYGHCQEDMLSVQALADETAIAASIQTSIGKYVKNGVVVDRVNLPVTLSKLSVLANGIDSVVVMGVPSAAKVLILGPVSNQGVADGTPITLTFAQPGQYLIRLDSFPFNDFEAKINAT